MRLFAIGLLVLVILLSTPSSGVAQSESLSTSGISIERSISKGQSHSFTVTLEAEQALQIVVHQRGIDVVVRLFAPDGSSLGEFDSPNGAEGPEPISLVSADGGAYRVEVAPLGQNESITSGRYEIKVVELRKATEQELLANKSPEVLKARALALLNEVADSLPQIRSIHTRVRAQVQLSTLVGSSDEKLARRFAMDAAEGVKQYVASLEGTEEDYYQSYEIAMQLRQEVVGVVGRYDVEAALAFLRATRGLTSPGNYQRNWDREQYLEMSLASQLASKDPNSALQIAEESLKRGLSGGLLEVINGLRMNDPELAAKLARQVAAKLLTEKLLKSQETTNLAMGLLRIAHMSPQRFQRAAAQSSKPQPPLLTEQEYKDLFEKALAEAIAFKGSAATHSPERNAAQNLLNALKSMTNEMTTYAPASLPLIEKRAAELNSVGDPTNLQWETFQRQLNKATLEEGLQLAASAPREMREQFYQQVAQKAVMAGDVARARQILRDNISNPTQRQQALSQLEQQVIFLDVNKGRVEEALRNLANLKNSRERATAIGQIAHQIGVGLKRADAINLLEQARSLVGSSSAKVENLEQMTAMVEIARALSRFDSKRAFETLEPLIDQFNEMTAAAVVLNNFVQQFYQNGELMMDNGNALSGMATQINQALGTLARANFDRAKSDADRMERPELRINAYIAIAQQMIGAASPMDRRFSSRRFFRE